jgi:hypothetical protein
MRPIPENYTDFLYWLKNQTENYWSQDPKTTSNESKCPQWAYGAKWIGMTDEQIDHLQEKYSIIFTPEHREFLRILHTIDRKEKVYREYGSEEGEYRERSFFHNWLEDDEDIRSRLTFVYDTISKDIASSRFWINSWGKRYDTTEERMEIFNELYEKAPKLVPVMGHRFQVADLSLEKRPVLSILGTDIVFYGSDFRYYLLDEIREHLNIHHLEYDEEDETSYWVLNEGYSDVFEHYDNTKLPDTPFWKSFFLFDWTDHSKNVNL